MKTKFYEKLLKFMINYANKNNKWVVKYYEDTCEKYEEDIFDGCVVYGEFIFDEYIIYKTPKLSNNLDFDGYEYSLWSYKNGQNIDRIITINI